MVNNQDIEIEMHSETADYSHKIQWKSLTTLLHINILLHGGVTADS